MTNTSNSPDSSGSQQFAVQRPRNGIARSTVLFLVAVAGLIGFTVGTRSHQLSDSIGHLFGVEPTGQLDLSSVQDTYRQLAKNYDGTVDIEKLIDGASRGLVQAAGDDYTVYMDAEEASEFNDSLSGSVSGIGAEIGVRNDTPTIIRVIPGSPAEQSGVKAQDKIMRVNDTITARYDAARTAEMIRGQAGTTVRLELMRAEEAVKLSITRALISDASVDSRREGEVGIIKLRRFDKDTGAQARQAAERLLAQGVKSIVLDMRDNGGGYLEQAPQVAGLWLDRQVVVSEKRGDKQTDELHATGTPLLAKIPTVVLVNESSASASEIVAGALQDHGVATVMGKQTYGKGSVQQLIRLSGGRLLKVTVARWYTPKGTSITDKGITPDKVVELSAEDYNASRDTQLQAAMTHLIK